MACPHQILYIMTTHPILGTFMNTTDNLGERVSRLEGGYEHLATKVDIAQIKADMSQMEIRITIRLGALIVAASGVIVALLKLLE